MWARFLALFTASDLDRDLNDELKTHVDMLAEDNLRRGMTPEAANRAARLELGGATQLREAHRETRGIPFIDTLLQDLRYTFRTLRRDAGFTTFAILIVGLGIGASATVFSLVEALLIRPLPFQNPSQLVWIANDGADKDLSGLTVPVGPFVDLRNSSHTFSDIAAYFAFYGVGDQMMTGDGGPERLSGVPVSHNFFHLLGVEPRLGRTFTAEECQGNQPVVVLSSGFWQRRFESDPGIVGRTLTLNGRAVTVIGVMPETFDFASVFAPGAQIDLFLPLPLTAGINSEGNTLSMIGRLKPGLTVAQAGAEATVLSGPISRKWNLVGGLLFRVKSLEEQVSGHLRSGLLVLSSAVFVVMLIVCVNLSNLQMARAATRRKEMAIRVAMGAGRARLIRQMLTESVILSCCAALLGLVLAEGGTRLLSHLDSISLPLRQAVNVDAWVLGFTLLTAVLTGIVFGFMPALQAPRVAVNDSLKDANRGSSEGQRQHWIRSALVVSEVAFACVLLVGAGLLIRSFLRVLDVDLGFHPENTVALRVDPGPQYSTQVMRNNYFDEVFRHVKAMPGVVAAGLSDGLPLGRNRSWGVGAKGIVYTAANPGPNVFVHVVSDGYLRAMGISLGAGRDLSDRDNAAAKPVILVNETLARTLWPGRDPLGQIMTADIDRQVVGIVRDVHHLALEQSSGNEMYIPIRQSNDYPSVDLVVRGSLPPAALASEVRAALKQIDPNLATNEFRTMQQIVDKAVSPRRFVVYLLGGFSAFALILVSLGIYGVIAYSVNQKARDIGIRMALGASAEWLQGRIIFETLGLAVIGMGIGAAGCWLVATGLSSLLFGVTPGDPVTFAWVLVILTFVAATASYLPARRASRIDPATALRVN